MIAAFAFYVFAAVMLGSAAMVVSSRNPVHSVLFLILAFFNASALFLLAGAEFLALILMIVYVGAVAVLFLFVVMMLDIDFAELRGGFQRYLPVGLAVGLVLLMELAAVLSGWTFAPGSTTTLRFAPRSAVMTNTAQLGTLLYTNYIFLFQTAGLVLLVAMIGAIVLTLRERGSSRHQVIAEQVARSRNSTLVMVDAARGAGVARANYYKPLQSEPQAVADAHEIAVTTGLHETAHGEGH